ncbi:MAG: class I SAM-dependent methyltransferase [Flavobacteriales bacterium]|nr:class I SAM-dependent methyltransferase [Flavobacteriales bacterium]
MDFLPEDIEAYANRFTAPEPPLLHELNRFTHTNVLQPRMLAGHLQGRVISMLSKMIKPDRVLEIGTYTGYSALCWAEGLSDGGRVDTIELDDELEPKIQAFFDRSAFKEMITLHIGNAMDVIDGLTESYDIVFMDADKVNYPNYLEKCFDKVKLGGYIIADNVLWSGKVTLPHEEMDPDTKALYAYAEQVQRDGRLEQVLLPVRDGLLIAKKISA